MTHFLLFVWAAINSAYATETTFIVVGPSAYGVAKWDVVERFFPVTDVRQTYDSTHPFTVWDQSPVPLPSAIDHVRLAPSNVSRLVLSENAMDAMNLDDIQLFYDLIKTTRPLVILEIGGRTAQLRSLLEKGTSCWGEGSASITTPHRVYLCNEVHPNRITAIHISEVHNIDITPVHENRADITFWPCIFATAAKHDTRKKDEVDEEVEVNRRVLVIEEDEDEEDNKKVELTGDEYRNKMKCKYRKSCYESGVLPDLKEQWNFPTSRSGNQEEAGEEQDDDEKEDIVSLKLKCKYRPSCYKKHDIPKKDDEEKEQVSFFSGKLSAPQGKKRTLKEIAEKTIQRVKAREGEASERELPARLIVERKLEAMGQEMNKKLACKYRKSCYDTGELPEIEQSRHLPINETENIKEEKEEVSFQELTELDRKVFCKYRKSCYETGEAPVILRTESYDTIQDIIEVESRKIPIQEKCKYRKSCYETGVIPDLSPQIVVSKKEMESEVPTSMSALKHFCKYRKSCYEEIALSDGVSAVKEIRKKRIVERETRRRLRRHGRRRHLVGDADFLRKPTRKEKAAARKAARLEREAAEELAAKELLLQDKGKEKEMKRKKHYTMEKEAVQVDESEINEQAEEQLENTASHIPQDVKPEDVAETVNDVKEGINDHKPGKKAKKSRTKSSKAGPEVIKEAAPEETVTKQTEKTKKGKKEQKKAENLEAEDEDVREEDETVAQPVANEKTKNRKRGQKKATNQDDEKIEQERTGGIPESKQVEPAPKKTKKAKKVPKLEEADEKIVLREEKPDEKSNDKKKLKKQKEETHKEESKTEKMEEEEFNKDVFDSKQQQRAFCKYRKSCYSSGQAPDLSRTYMDVIKDFNMHVEAQYQTELQKHIKEEDKKLSCKYRKSCYETGQMPVIRSLAAAPSFDKEVSIQMKCKYRKSCYEKHGLKEEEVDKSEEIPVAEEQDKKSEEKTPLTPPIDADEEKTGKRKKKRTEVEKKQEELKHEDRGQELQEAHLDSGDKLQCKYRRSCYTSAPPKATREDHSGSMARIGVKPDAVVVSRAHCHEYWLSCREKLGLPPKEKAPIGPNGKRLCRKKAKPQ